MSRTSTLFCLACAAITALSSAATALACGYFLFARPDVPIFGSVYINAPFDLMPMQVKVVESVPVQVKGTVGVETGLYPLSVRVTN